MPGPRAVSMLLLAVVVAVLSGVEAAKCVCNLPKDPGPCKGSISKFYFNAKTGNCEHFFYGGCKGNKNRFNTRAKCEKRCRISTEIELICPVVPTETVGACAEMCPAGGCPKGKMCCSNGCGHTCKDPVPTKPMPEVCCLQKDPGPCKGYFPRYFYSKTAKCVKFIYGGCGANGNNFKSRAECRKMCK